MRDLEDLLSKNDRPKKIVVLYSIGHMYDLSERIVYLLKFQHLETRWLDAGATKMESKESSPGQRKPGETDF